jgi:hypothetical protein
LAFRVAEAYTGRSRELKDEKRPSDDASRLAVPVYTHGPRAGFFMANKKQSAGAIGAKLSEAEQDLLQHLEQGYKLETDTLGSNPLLRGQEDDEVLRLASANRNTIKALEERGLIVRGKSSDALKIVWRLK